MGMTMSRNKELPTFFGEVLLKGERIENDFENNITPNTSPSKISTLEGIILSV